MGAEVYILKETHPVLTEIVSHVGEILCIPTNELPLQMKLQRVVCQNFNDYLVSELSMLPIPQDEDVALELSQAQTEQQFWQCIKNTVSPSREEFLERFYQNYS
jgi:hypothetical protein